MINFHTRTGSRLATIADNQCIVLLNGAVIEEVVLCTPQCYFKSHMVLSCTGASHTVMTMVWNQWSVSRHRVPFPVTSIWNKARFMCYVSDDVPVEINFANGALMFSVRSVTDAKMSTGPSLTIGRKCLPLINTATSVPFASSLSYSITPLTSAADTCSTQTALSILQNTKRGCLRAGTSFAQSVALSSQMTMISI